MDPGSGGRPPTRRSRPRDDLPETVSEPVAEPAVAGSELTPRQREVLLALSSGRTYKEIGVQLGMSAKTVMHHSAEIYRRLGVRGRGEATVWAFRRGLGDRSVAREP